MLQLDFTATVWALTPREDSEKGLLKHSPGALRTGTPSFLGACCMPSADLNMIGSPRLQRP